jgi:hypothetical protein
MIVKVNDLESKFLDWVVAKCLGATWEIDYTGGYFIWPTTYSVSAPSYSSDWAVGGPIIEREKIQILPRNADWVAVRYGPGKAITGPTPLVAAMRCFIASKLGDEVEVHPSLLEQT